jgi:hypothetical protein
MQNEIHQITITQKKEVAITGIESVLAFSEAKITLGLRGGGRLYVAGSGLKIAGFSKDSGVFTAVGNIVGVSYGGKSFAARLFR